MIRDVPDPCLDFLPIQDPGSRSQKGTGYRIRIRNTDCLEGAVKISLITLYLFILWYKLQKTRPKSGTGSYDIDVSVYWM